MIRIRLVHDRAGEGKEDKDYLVQIEIYQYYKIAKRAKKKYVSTGIHCKPGQWRAGKVEKHPRANAFNKKIGEILHPIENFIDEEGDSFTFEKLNRFLDGTYGQTFHDFMRLEIENSPTSERTLSQHWATHGHLCEFQDHIGFKQVDYQLIKDFDKYLRKLGLMDSTIYGHHKRLRHYVHEAVKHGYITYQKDPYLSFKLKTVKYETVKYLEESALVKLRDYDFSGNKKLEKVRDFYVFCCYTGLAYQDAANFQKSDITEEDGIKYIQNPRHKTDEQSIIVLFDEALDILGKYRFKLPVISNQKTNDFLKIIASAIGIDINLTTHTARHTCAVLLLNKGMGYEYVSRWLGHASPKTTMETYAKVLKSTMLKEYLKVKRKLK